MNISDGTVANGEALQEVKDDPRREFPQVTSRNRVRDGRDWQTTLRPW